MNFLVQMCTWSKAPQTGINWDTGRSASLLCVSSQSSLGKHAQSLALITGALNLSSTTHTLTHARMHNKNWTYKLKYMETISPQRHWHDWNKSSHSGQALWERTICRALNPKLNEQKKGKPLLPWNEEYVIGKIKKKVIIIKKKLKNHPKKKVPGHLPYF